MFLNCNWYKYSFISGLQSLLPYLSIRLTFAERKRKLLLALWLQGGCGRAGAGADFSRTRSSPLGGDPRERQSHRTGGGGGLGSASTDPGGDTACSGATSEGQILSGSVSSFLRGSWKKKKKQDKYDAIEQTPLVKNKPIQPIPSLKAKAVQTVPCAANRLPLASSPKAKPPSGGSSFLFCRSNLRGMVRCLSSYVLWREDNRISHRRGWKNLGSAGGDGPGGSGIWLESLLHSAHLYVYLLTLSSP